MADELESDERITMKPMLGALVQEAVKLALIDSAIPAENDQDGQARCWTDEEIADFRRDIFSLPSDAIARMDPLALAQNVAVRLLGPGGWTVNGVYGGNASARDLMEATFERPDQRHVDDMTFDFMQHFQPPPEPDDAPDE